MQIRTIGCHGGVSPGYDTTCYCIDDRFYIDAGSISSAQTVAQQFKVRDVFITHPHLDHIKDLAFLIENTFHDDRPRLHLRSTPEILNDIHSHIFNDVIWPDFSRIPRNKNDPAPIMSMDPMINGQIQLTHGDTTYEITAIPVNHPGHAVGYVVDDGQCQAVFTGDTGPTQKLWEAANRCTNLQAVFSEISFPNYMKALASSSGHMTLSMLSEELEKLGDENIIVHIAHFKPLFFDELMAEFNRHAHQRLRLLHQNDVINLT